MTPPLSSHTASTLTKSPMTSSATAGPGGSAGGGGAPPGGPVLQSRRTLYVGGLSETVTPTTLRAAMVPFGPLKSIDVPMDYQKGTHRGFAFVEYDDADDAAEAIYNMDGSELDGRTLSVNLARHAGSVKLGSHKPVWSTDEWFQEQTSGGGGEDGGGAAKDGKDTAEGKAADERALKEKSPAVAAAASSR